jgi:protocatechuate 3,4-dioxygenase beta subunit
MPGFNACKGKEPDIIPDENDCVTTEDILGPFYKAGAPFRENVVPLDSNMGAPLVIEGKVFAECNTVLNNAIVEIWNADDEGTYDTSEEFRFRGRYKTGADGVYRFKTIVPGRYLNGGTFRPSHIHFRITASGYQELVSQIYFKDDPFIESDPWAGSPKASERILTIGNDANGTDTVNFNIYLMANT